MALYYYSVIKKKKIYEKTNIFKQIHCIAILLKLNRRKKILYSYTELNAVNIGSINCGCTFNSYWRFKKQRYNISKNLVKYDAHLAAAAANTSNLDTYYNYHCYSYSMHIDIISWQ